MPLTEIKAQVEIPEGFEFDRIDTFVKEGDYRHYGSEVLECEGVHSKYERPTIILRKIKPKKPAYRVYRSKETGNTFTRDSLSGTRDNELSDKCEWIREWIEYVPPKKWPTPLVERIAAIDLEAAQWIVDHWDELLEGDYSCCGRYSRDSEKLYNMFFWDHSQQKDEYWRKIAEQLAE